MTASINKQSQSKDRVLSRGQSRIILQNVKNKRHRQSWTKSGMMIGLIDWTYLFECVPGCVLLQVKWKYHCEVARGSLSALDEYQKQQKRERGRVECSKIKDFDRKFHLQSIYATGQLSWLRPNRNEMREKRFNGTAIQTVDKPTQKISIFSFPSMIRWSAILIFNLHAEDSFHWKDCWQTNAGRLNTKTAS